MPAITTCVLGCATIYPITGYVKVLRLLGLRARVSREPLQLLPILSAFLCVGFYSNTVDQQVAKPMF